MENNELLRTLIEVNKTMDNPLDDVLIESIISCVIMHPLPQDRGICQERLTFIISQHSEK